LSREKAALNLSRKDFSSDATASLALETAESVGSAASRASSIFTSSVEALEIQARIDEEVAKRISSASTDEVKIEEALDAAEPTDSAVSNANEAVASEEKSFRDKFRAAFSRDNIEIS
jgi:hypothetical protein